VLRSGAIVVGSIALGTTSIGSATAQRGRPDFSSSVWGDGEQWGTKVTGTFDEPRKKHNLDKLFVVTTDHEHPPDHEEHAGHHPHPLPDDQLPVAEAAPGNRAYNGGRWWTHTATWTHQGIHDHDGSVPLLTRYGPANDPNSILFHENLGHIRITEGSPDDTPDFFRCPLLPDKEE
jgi:hypothetical protein